MYMFMFIHTRRPQHEMYSLGDTWMPGLRTGAVVKRTPCNNTSKEDLSKVPTFTCSLYTCNHRRFHLTRTCIYMYIQSMTLGCYHSLLEMRWNLWHHGLCPVGLLNTSSLHGFEVRDNVGLTGSGLPIGGFREGLLAQLGGERVHQGRLRDTRITVSDSPPPPPTIVRILVRRLTAQFRDGRNNRV